MAVSRKSTSQSPDFLFSWLGRTDVLAGQGHPDAGLGPVAQALEQKKYQRLVLLSNYPPEESEPYHEWIASRNPETIIDIRQVNLSGPTSYKDIFQGALQILLDIREKYPKANLTFHLSPGTPVMAAVWIILAKTRFQAGLIESSRDHGVREVDFPFDLSAEYLPDATRQKDARLEHISAALPPLEPAFEDIIHRCQAMQRIMHKAGKVSLRTVPVLIEGESGTGKELLARAIHRAGPRRDGPFVAVNCGAIPFELLESELFGHVKGAFTGADRSRTGFLKQLREALCFWMRSENCLSRPRSRSCGPFRKAKSSGWVNPKQSNLIPE